MQMLPPFFNRAPALTGVFLLLAALLTGCASKNPLMENPAPVAAGAPQVDAATSVQTVNPKKRFFGIFKVYRPDVQQGNFVSKEMVAQLKPGMTPDQVTFLLGTPLLNDVFHADRWDYDFRLQKGNGAVTTSRVTVFFKDKLVTHFEGGSDLPTEKDYLERIADKAKALNK
jgi:outer membrane protein assembly factor BamE